jgi:hypothetical protein
MEAAFQWVAANDNPCDPATIEEIAGWMTTLFVADLWGLEPLEVATAVDGWRKKFGRAETASLDAALEIALTDKDRKG